MKSLTDIKKNNAPSKRGPKPKGFNHLVSVRLDEPTHEKIEQMADRAALAVNRVVRMLVEDALRDGWTIGASLKRRGVQ